MILVLVFGVALLVAVLLSGVAARSVLSTSLLFLVAGALVGDGVLGWIHVNPDSAVVSDAADLALFTVLFTDGAKLRRLRGEGSWQGPLRALGIGMPLTFGLVAVLAHYLAGLDWIPALLAGAVLAPTDPVFASAIVSRTHVPARLRRLLSIESGLNDGLALPVVVLLLAATGFVAPDEPTSVPRVLVELGGGVVLGIVAPLAAWALFRIPRLGVTPQLQPLGPVALAVSIYGLAHLLGVNAYLAAFLGGALLGVLAPAAHDAFEPLGDQLSELAKFAALLVFGAVLTPTLFTSVPAGAWAVAVLTLVLARPAAVALSLVGRTIDRTELFTAAWFGPKGFASVVYGLLVLHSGTPEAEQVYGLVAVTIALSIVVHSSTDIPVARLFRTDEGTGEAAPADEGTATSRG